MGRMTGAVELFLVEPTGSGVLSLRRYRASDVPCPGPHGYCSESVDIAEVQILKNADGTYPALSPENVEYADPRWPRACSACGYEFGPDDPRQCNQTEFYANADGTVRTALRDLPAGAVYDAAWLPDLYRAPDGHAWAVQLPDGLPWYLFGPASNGGAGWTVTGDAPRFTANPSILTPDYHGWLNDGRLTPC